MSSFNDTDVEILMKSEDETEFNEEYSECSLKWDLGIKNYFNPHLKMAIMIMT